MKLLMHHGVHDVTASCSSWRKNDEDIEFLKLWDQYWIKAILAEFLATYFFMYVMFLSISSAVANKWETGALVCVVSFAIGLAIVAVVSAFGRISGAHLNPAVTFGLIIIGQVELVRALVYIVVQIIAATLASLAVEVSGQKAGWAELHAIHTDGLSFGQVVFIEASLTCLLMMVIVAIAVDPQNVNPAITAPLTIGLLVSSLVMAGAMTTSSYNPARSIGPALASGYYDENLFATILGPFIGCGIGAVLYNIVFHEHEDHIEEKLVVDKSRYSRYSAGDDSDEGSGEHSSRRKVVADRYTRTNGSGMRDLDSSSSSM